MEFRPRSAFYVSGCSMSGKTQFVFRLLKEKHTLFGQNAPHSILYCYGIYQSLFDDMERELDNFTLHEGIPSKETIDSLTADRKHHIVVLDDLWKEVVNNPNMSDMFTMRCHHANISVVFLTQNLFPDGRYSRTIALNTSYMVLFKNVRDASQITTLGKQMFPGHKDYLISAYEDSVKRAYGYLVIDLGANTDPKLRLKTNIFLEEQPVIVYLPRCVLLLCLSCI